jgi:putative endonuclease
MAADVDAYSVYVLRCRDGSYYTGIATDVDRRIAEHDGGRRGAKYLRGRGPFELVFSCPIGDRGRAQRVEAWLKKLPSREKSDAQRLAARIEAMMAADVAVQ